ncbi:hypothetical protein ABXW85_22785, partial [Streptococcus suis]
MVKGLTKELFIETSNVILVTNFTNEAELVTQLHQNGYRVLAYFSQINPTSTFLEVPVLHDF